MSAKSLLLVSVVLKTVLGAPLIQLPNGQIQGSERTTLLANKTVYSFEGIPYAAPPLGPLRFMAPQPVENWEGVLDATNYNSHCFETTYNSDFETEDCLHVNVFTPMLPDETNNASLPVMVVFYGGGFNSGHAAKDPDLFIENDIIVVTFNYRIGIFGFLSTEDEIVPGNAGLKDQSMVLRWVSTNIHLFGGDPNRVTLTGQSAGSAGIAYQLFNHENEGLFQGVIMQSGTALSPWAYQRDAREIAFAVGTLMHSQFETEQDSQTLLDFLQNATAADIDWVAERYLIVQNLPLNLNFFQGYTYSPVIEVKNPTAVITRKMYGLLEAGNFITVPILMGLNSEESISLIPGAEVIKIAMMIYDDHPEWLVPHDMQIADPEELFNMGSSIKDIYTEGAPLAENLGAGVRYCSDNALARSILKYGEMVSKFSDTYFYEFAYKGPMGQHDLYIDGAETVGHGEENYYLYCHEDGCDASAYPQEDQLTRERLLKIWTNFIKYQNPTPEPSELLNNLTWPLLGSNEGNFYYLNINETLEIENHPPKQEMFDGWKALYDSLGPIELDTY